MLHKEKLFTFIFASLIFSLPTKAAERSVSELSKSILDNEVAAVYGKACEPFREGEPKSSARVRVIDKASFVAAENLSMLDDFRAKVEEQDFNMLIYNLVDNAMEDLAVRTLKQDDKNICVEITGYVSKRNVIAAMKDLLPKEEKIVAPTPQPEVQVASEPQVVEQKPEEIVAQPVAPMSNSNTSVWIEPTEFYNKTSSDKFAEIIARQFEAEDIALAQKKEGAAYVIKSNVLRAKVDPINSNTNRLQMVVAVELEDANGNRISTEHQNRFVLFSAEEDEQEVALRLMKKLFENACERISKKIEPASQPSPLAGEQLFAPIITPAASQKQL